MYDNYDPSRVCVAVGGTLPLIGAFAVPATAPDPRDVSPSTGRIVYRLPGPGGAGDAPGSQRGILTVEMLDASTLRVEASPDATVTDLPFSGAARRYVR